MASSLASADIAARFRAMQGMGIELGRLAMTYFTDRASLGTSMKGFQDWLTVADGKVEAAFRGMIAETFPGDAVMGEELGGGAHERLWIIDPIDGTSNFARGDRMWCVSIGFVLDGRPELGTIHAPALGETYLARRGQGATMNGEAISVAPTTDIRRASVEIGWSPRRPLDAYLGPVRAFFEKGASVRRSASGAMGIAHVANGRNDAYVEAHINAWDVAAGLVIASEAGALANDFCAGDWLRNGNPIAVATPGIATAVTEATGLTLISPAKD